MAATSERSARRYRWPRFGMELTMLWLLSALFLQRDAIRLAFDPAACLWGDPAIPARGLVLLGLATPLDCQALLHIDLWRALGLAVLMPLIAWLVVPAVIVLYRRVAAGLRRA